MKRSVILPAFAFWLPPAASVALADSIEICVDEDTGAVYRPLGKEEGQCRTGDRLTQLGPRTGEAQQVEGTGVLASWLDGDIAVVAEETSFGDEGPVCALWFEANSNVRSWRLRTVAEDEGGTSNLTANFLDPNRGLHPMNMVRAYIVIVRDFSGQQRDGAPLEVAPPNIGANQHEEFVTDEGFHLTVTDALLTWDFGREPGCYGRASVTASQS